MTSPTREEAMAWVEGPTALVRRAEKAEADLSAARLRIMALEAHAEQLLVAMGVADQASVEDDDYIPACLDIGKAADELRALLSVPQGETRGGDRVSQDPGPHPCGEQDEQAVGATAALAGWRPISSAPKDGSAVLLFFPKRYSGSGGISWGCHVSGDWLDSRAIRDNDASHWMPLPEPPAPGEGQ